MKLRRAAAATVTALLLLASHPAVGQQKPSKEKPVLLTADEMNYDRDKGVVTAKGHVEISQGARVLKADSVVYNRNTGVVTAQGNVSLTEPTGEVIFTDSIKLTKQMREGVVDNIRMIFPDDTRFAANGAVRLSGNTTDMRKAVFSPCELCANDPTAPPLWQIRARRVVHDQTKHNIETYDGFMEIGGVPVAYVPYFWYPDPTVKRRTGFLPPVFGHDSELGFTARTPFFINLAPDWDATFSPIFATKEYPVAAGEVRHRLRNGKIRVEGSITRAADRDLHGRKTGRDITRGHFFSQGRFDIDKTWRWGFDGAYASDDTYLRRYNLDRQNLFSQRQARDEVLTSRAFVEGFRDRSYASAETFHFQGLRQEDKQGQSPIIAPLLTYNFVSDPGFHGSHWSIDANALGLTRTDGTDSRRFSMLGGWHLPLRGQFGDLINLSATIQSDFYWVNSVNRDAPDTKYSGLAWRVFPQFTADWRYPLVRELGNVRHLIEPRVAFIAGPNDENPSKIPNEDSQNLEFDDTNLFSDNRFPGRDRVDSGQRIVYGLRNAFYGDNGGSSEIFFGQSYRLTKNRVFAEDSGLRHRLSDFVGRVSIHPFDNLDLLYRFRLDRNSLDPRRHEVSFSAGPKAFHVGASYLLFNESPKFADFGHREEVAGYVSSQLTKYWSVAGRTRWRLAGPDKGPITHGVSLTYEDECTIISADFSRNFSVDRDIRPSTEFFVRVVFKRVGELSAGTQ